MALEQRRRNLRASDRNADGLEDELRLQVELLGELAHQRLAAGRTAHGIDSSARIARTSRAALHRRVQPSLSRFFFTDFSSSVTLCAIEDERELLRSHRCRCFVALCDERIELFEPGAVGFDIFSACETRFDEEGSDRVHPGSSTHVLDIDRRSSSRASLRRGSHPCA